MDFGLSDEFRTPGRPKVVITPDVGHAKVHKDAESVWIARRRGDDFRLVVGRAATAVDNEPNIAESQKCRLALAQYRGAKDVAVECH